MRIYFARQQISKSKRPSSFFFKDICVSLWVRIRYCWQESDGEWEKNPTIFQCIQQRLFTILWSESKSPIKNKERDLAFDKEKQNWYWKYLKKIGPLWPDDFGALLPANKSVKIHMVEKWQVTKYFPFFGDKVLCLSVARSCSLFDVRKILCAFAFAC